MTHRERVLTAFKHQEPDRVPIDLGGSLASTIVTEAYPALRRELGLPVHVGTRAWEYASLAKIEEDVRQALDVDIVHAPAAAGAGIAKEVLSDDTFVDEWNVRWHRPAHGHYYVDYAPFEDRATVRAVEQHRWPEPRDMVKLDGVADALRTLRAETDYAVSIELRGRVMSLGQFLRGFEHWMMDLADNKSFVDALLERTTQIQIDINDLVLGELGDLVDIVYTSDDLGGQIAPLISPACFRESFKTHFRRIWQRARKKTSAALAHHCCGSAHAFIGDFIELGVEALNPIQVSAAGMDPTRLKAEFGKDLTFWGGVDTRHVMPHGTIQDVRDEVARRIRQMGPGGGYVLAAVHNIQPEVPPANVIAMYKAARELGQYPLK